MLIMFYYTSQIKLNNASKCDNNFKKYFTLIFQDLVVVVVDPIRKFALWHAVEASTITEDSRKQ